MTELSIPSTDQKNKLHVEVWEPEGEIRAILQISHGMVEYVERFQNFALWLNQYGILVIGNDHLGHGKTAAGDADLGYIGAGKSKTLVDDQYEVTKYAKKTYGDVPLFLFGHSMGSFLARRYLMEYGGTCSGCRVPDRRLAEADARRALPLRISETAFLQGISGSYSEPAYGE